MRKHYERILHDSESRVQRYLDIQILDENSPFCGGFPKADSLAEPKTAIYRATTMTACYLNPESRYYLDAELGRRLALGDFHELNVIVKGDVDGSVEALSDSLIKLSTEQVQVNVIHKGVGQISESDVSLAAASDAIIVGFQVRPSGAAAKMAEQEGVDIRKYSVIYDAIEEVKAAMEGMLAPTLKEQITATIEVREVFNITKVGLVAGAMVKTGKVKRSDKARLIRDGIVIFTGAINALKRFKDDVKEVGTNFECGISLTNCNDIKVGDIIESYEEIEVKQTL